MAYKLVVTEEQLKLMESLVDSALKSHGLAALNLSIEILNVLRAAKPVEEIEKEE